MFLFIVVSIFILLHIFVAFYQRTKPRNSTIPLQSVENYHELSLLIPCYNEAVIIKSAIYSLTKQGYPNLEIVFINDGSKDQTLALLKQELDLKVIENRTGILEAKPIKKSYQSKKYKNIFVIDKENSGKADSLNAGINFTNKQYVVTLDADSILKEDALFKVNDSLQDKDVIALGGNVVVAQGVRNYQGDTIHSKIRGKMLERVQFIEYLRGFFILKNSLAALNAQMVISGAFGVFNREVMLEVEGFEDTVGEDIDITIKFNKYAQKHDKKLLYNDAALCFTEVPDNWSDMIKQRVRWQKAFLDALKNHKKFIFKKMFKTPLAFFMLIESTVLMYTATLMTIVGAFYLGVQFLQRETVDPMIYYMFAFGLVIFMIYNIVTFKLAQNGNISLKGAGFFKLLGIFLYEMVWYRFMMLGIILYGSVAYLFNPKGWNKVSRIGVSDEMVAAVSKEAA